jgi:hypothetical protein
MNNLWERFFSAAQTLSAAGPIKQRLVNAYGNHLANLQTDEVPREIREEFVNLGSNFASVTPLRGETAIQASVRKMSDHDAATLSLRIINLMGSMVRLQLQPRQPVLRAVNSGDD